VQVFNYKTLVCISLRYKLNYPKFFITLSERIYPLERLFLVFAIIFSWIYFYLKDPLYNCSFSSECRLDLSRNRTNWDNNDWIDSSIIFLIWPIFWGKSYQKLFLRRLRRSETTRLATWYLNRIDRPNIIKNLLKVAVRKWFI